MISSNLNQSSLPLKKRNQDQSHLPTSTTTTNTSYPRPVFLETSIEDHGHHYHQQQQQEKTKEFVLIDGSSDFLQPFSTNNEDNNEKMDQHVCDGYHHEVGHESVKWMPSKMRWIRKMVASEQTVRSKPRRSMENLQVKSPQNQDSNSNFRSGTIRVCSDCSTTKTPLWRSGPQGPKSLCNACGIRQRKARRAMAAAAAAAAAGSGLLAMNTQRKVQKEKRTDRDLTIPNKKRCKMDNTRPAQKKLQIDDIMMSLSNNSAFHRVFPQDEKDAAILLMALSCGLIHG